MLLYEHEELLPVKFIHQPVTKDSIKLVDPQSDQLVGVPQMRVWNCPDSLDNSSKVSQVEEIVTFRRGGKEGGQNAFIQLQGGFH